MRAAEWSPVPAGGALDQCAQILERGAEAERLRAAYALASRGAEAVPCLVAALRRQAAALRQRNLEADHTNPSQLDAVFGLSAVGARAVPAVTALLDDEAWWVRAAAADVLGDMGESARDAVPQLTGALSDKSSWVRRNAVEALGYLGPAAATAVAALGHCLSDADLRVRHNAALTLAKLGPAAAAAIPPCNDHVGRRAMSTPSLPPHQCSGGPSTAATRSCAPALRWRSDLAPVTGWRLVESYSLASRSGATALALGTVAVVAGAVVIAARSDAKPGVADGRIDYIFIYVADTHRGVAALVINADGSDA